MDLHNHGPVAGPNPERGDVNAEQYEFLMYAIKRGRLATRKVSGKNLTYLQAWDVKAHLTRIFGFGHFDIITERERYLGERFYTSSGSNSKAMVEVSWQATVTLVVRDEHQREIARYTEGAVGSATGGAEGAGLGDLHDNALKQAASDALKRCAINLGTQFGLSLYNDGQAADVIGNTLVKPDGVAKKSGPDSQTQENLGRTLGVDVKDNPDDHQSDEDVASGMDGPDQGVHQHDGA